jgi:hypothetical protein
MKSTSFLIASSVSAAAAVIIPASNPDHDCSYIDITTTDTEFLVTVDELPTGVCATCSMDLSLGAANSVTGVSYDCTERAMNPAICNWYHRKLQ